MEPGRMKMWSFIVSYEIIIGNEINDEQIKMIASIDKPAINTPIDTGGILGLLNSVGFLLFQILRGNKVGFWFHLFH